MANIGCICNIRLHVFFVDADDDANVVVGADVFNLFKRPGLRIGWGNWDRFTIRLCHIMQVDTLKSHKKRKDENGH